MEVKVAIDADEIDWDWMHAKISNEHGSIILKSYFTVDLLF